MTRRTFVVLAALCAAFLGLTPAAATQQSGAHPVDARASFKALGDVVFTLVPVHGTWSADYEKSATDQNLLQVLTIEGMTSKPVAPNTKPDGSDDAEGRRRNRRVEIVVQK